jgi:hypothetical protein
MVKKRIYNRFRLGACAWKLLLTSCGDLTEVQTWLESASKRQQLKISLLRHPLRYKRTIFFWSYPSTVLVCGTTLPEIPLSPACTRRFTSCIKLQSFTRFGHKNDNASSAPPPGGLTVPHCGTDLLMAQPHQKDPKRAKSSMLAYSSFGALQSSNYHRRYGRSMFFCGVPQQPFQIFLGTFGGGSTAPFCWLRKCKQVDHWVPSACGGKMRQDASANVYLFSSATTSRWWAYVAPQVSLQKRETTSASFAKIYVV